MDTQVHALLNDQINKELYSAYLYMSFADYYDEVGLAGYANWYMIQAAEERDHALVIRNYLRANGQHITLDAIDAPDKTFNAYIDPLKAGLEHERYVTSLINAIYAAADRDHDYRTLKFLDWFITEQGEEEENAEDMVKQMELFGGDAKSLYDLDQSYAARAYSQAAPLVQKA
ncbi:MAG: ferritin [Eggerthellaceae bacterium]|jgi:ferritin|nr:ferritin [Eggerthellaceae bacterium]MCH4220961.1 ferritin [Eggerthellaceae bacterium]